ncbi:hypothetical protein F7725_004151 [Dissostichus mawsoni]|uniref:Uncharacterized protein n=1 Tax=Dissostichus mawsoni TaxID=36200 RepID=A0A7J5XJA8_DISMA|nr:hypothetical protein F7725_004151 [Dissostichus mawsoni]
MDPGRPHGARTRVLEEAGRGFTPARGSDRIYLAVHRQRHREADGHAAVEANASEEKDASIHVGLEDQTEDFTEPLRKGATETSKESVDHLDETEGELDAGRHQQSGEQSHVEFNHIRWNSAPCPHCFIAQDAADKEVYNQTPLGILCVGENPQLNPSSVAIV